MSRRPFARRAVAAAAALAVMLLAAPSAAPGNNRGSLAGPKNLRVTATTPHSVDPQYAISYEIRVNGVFDGAGTAIDRWITYGTQTSNTYSVQAVDSTGNRSPASSLTLDNQAC